MDKSISFNLNELLQISFQAIPEPLHDRIQGYCGMSEKEILKKHRHNEINRLTNGDETYLEIRLAGATLTCVLDENLQCKNAFLFSDE